MIAVAFAGGYNACADPASTGPAYDGPTYHRDVAPILARDCVECHRAGGIAPFPLATYEEVAPHAARIAAATAARTMPPSNLDGSGACNTYVDGRWLADDEIAAIMLWAEAGAPAGAPPTEPPPEAPPGWTLDRVDLTLAMPEAYTPSEAVDDDYRCFIIDPGLAEDVFVTGFEVRLGREQTVHHMTLFALDSEADELAAAELDAAEAAPGYTCLGDTVVPSRWLVGAGPGDRGSLLPEGTGLLMAAGRKTVLQMHYNRLHGAAPDRTAIDLKLERSVARPAVVERIAAEYFELPPGQREVVVTEEMELGADFTLWGVWPHMHNTGARLRVTASRADSETCLARVNRYSFHWQRFAFYERPIRVREGDVLRIECTYDTTGRDETTWWGLGTADEMCIGFFYITEAFADDERRPRPAGVEEVVGPRSYHSRDGR